MGIHMLLWLQILFVKLVLVKLSMLFEPAFPTLELGESN